MKYKTLAVTAAATLALTACGAEDLLSAVVGSNSNNGGTKERIEMISREIHLDYGQLVKNYFVRDGYKVPETDFTIVASKWFKGSYGLAIYNKDNGTTGVNLQFPDGSVGGVRVDCRNYTYLNDGQWVEPFQTAAYVVGTVCALN